MKRRLNTQTHAENGELQINLYSNSFIVDFDSISICSKCLDGTVICSLKYNTTLPLSDDQITLLKNDILQLFYYRYTYPNAKNEKLDVIHADEHSHNSKCNKLNIDLQSYDFLYVCIICS